MEELKEYVVYKHTSPSNKVYIGITRMPPKKRWQNGKGYRHNEYFNRAIEKYGWNNFKHEILYENLTKHEASDKERELIKQYNSTDINCGYNLDYGGCYCDRLTPELRKKLSEALKGKTSHKLSNEQKQEISKRKHKLWANNEFKKWATEQISKVNNSKVKCIETGKIYNSIKEASKDTGANERYISICCREKQRTSGGYHWEYVEKTKRKMDLSRNGKKVAQYDKDGKLIKIYNTITLAEKETGESRSTIRRSACNLKKYIMKKKYIWKYVDNCALLDLNSLV